MENIKKILGILWLLLAVLTAYFCIAQFGLPKIMSGKQEDVVFGVIILCILTPIISIGLGIFGYFALNGEYRKDRM